jgi:folate-binding protein YgfZ
MNSNFENEYKAVRNNGAGILNFPSRGLIEVSGSEAIQFLNGLITNDVAKLENNEWMQAAFPNAQGRLLAMVRVLKSDDKFLFDVDAANREKILQNLMRFTFAGDFKVIDLSDNYSLISIQGKRAAEIILQIPNSKFQIPEIKNQISVFEFQNSKIQIVRAPHAAENNFDLFVPNSLSENLQNKFSEFGAIQINEEVREVLRIEAGIPKYGVDMDESTIVLETGLDEAVSFNKGCYIGQEIIARIHFRGHVAKRLSGLILEETIEIQPGDQLKSAEGKAAGRITSTVFSPSLDKQIALALVRYEFLAPETKLFVVRGENQLTEAKVIELPFVRDS